MSFRSCPSPLHACGAPVGMLFCAALGAAAITLSHPVALAALVTGEVLVAICAGAVRQLRWSLRLALPLGVMVMLVNALVVRDGLTVILRLGSPLGLGPVDVTLEALVLGAALGLRAAALVLAGGIFGACVDPHAVLRLFRRLSFRTGLTAALALRLVPVLTADARRVAEAQRCRPSGGHGRAALVRAITAGGLERALEVAATLELRGFAGGARPPRDRRPLTVQDLGFTAGALLVTAVSVLGRFGGGLGFTAYPRLRVPLGMAAWLEMTILLLAMLVPFLIRRGVG